MARQRGSRTALGSLRAVLGDLFLDPSEAEARQRRTDTSLRPLHPAVEEALVLVDDTSSYAEAFEELQRRATDGCRAGRYPSYSRIEGLLQQWAANARQPLPPNQFALSRTLNQDMLS
jgi:hypothetical protein